MRVPVRRLFPAPVVPEKYVKLLGLTAETMDQIRAISQAEDIPLGEVVERVIAERSYGQSGNAN